MARGKTKENRIVSQKSNIDIVNRNKTIDFFVFQYSVQDKWQETSFGRL